MTPKEFNEEMQRLINDDDAKDQDVERLHLEMDNLMCKVLRELGYRDGVAVFENTYKYYG